MSKGIRKIVAAMLVLTMIFVAACSSKEPAKDTKAGDAKDKKTLKATMITDVGGVNDKSFNQSAYEGLKELEASKVVEKANYVESKQEADYKANIDSAVDGGNDIVWGIGYALFKAIDAEAKANPDQKFAIIDSANENNVKNLIGVTFADNENSFLAGYVAGMTSKTNNVGFIGGVKGDVISRFDYGYKAGVKHAAREKGTEIKMQSQYANSFSDAAKGKAIAKTMYQGGADVLFAAAGNVGMGIFEAAKEVKDGTKYVIGVDRDQSAEAPEHMLCSTVKGVNVAIKLITEKLYNTGGFDGGTTISYGLKDSGAVDIKYAPNKLVEDAVKKNVETIKGKIVAGEIKVPANEKEFAEFGYDK